MGKCRITDCPIPTKYNHNNGWCFFHFFFNYKRPRFYVAIVITFLLEFIMSAIGWVDELVIWVPFTDAFFNVTKFIPFLWLKILIILAIPISSFLGVSKFIYMTFKIN